MNIKKKLKLSLDDERQCYFLSNSRSIYTVVHIDGYICVYTYIYMCVFPPVYVDTMLARSFTLELNERRVGHTNKHINNINVTVHIYKHLHIHTTLLKVCIIYMDICFNVMCVFVYCVVRH